MCAAHRGLAKGGRWTGEVRCLPERLDEPLRWRKPRRVAMGLMGDLFHEAVPDGVIDRVWVTMALAPAHTFLILTKRPERLRRYLTDPGLYRRVLREADRIRSIHPQLGDIGISNPATSPLRWVHLGTSAEDQATLVERLPYLLATPAAVRFLSLEPLLAPVRLPLGWREVPPGTVGIDWLICGGEAGPGARPCEVGWIRSVVEQCRDARVPCWVKQLGARPVVADADFGNLGPYTRCAEDGSNEVRFYHHSGADPSEWPEDLRVREVPAGQGMQSQEPK